MYERASIKRRASEPKPQRRTRRHYEGRRISVGALAAASGAGVAGPPQISPSAGVAGWRSARAAWARTCLRPLMPITRRLRKASEGHAAAVDTLPQSFYRHIERLRT
ncbi:hypothetical protein EVAR_29601_1 [Eumeta japonica]|uniref:Uncharacterized protein n=1 Tax=Eumeta variegata TaxID=151549 RepID=A0A4C1VWP0_EUMVA|nr:hypothetical protein EVAR_29601_1 [Eumeta japonica]